MSSSVLVILLMLFCSAFFSGGEMAFLASNKLMLELNRKRYPRMSRIIDIFMLKPDLLISTILVGNNVALVVYGLEFGNLFGPMIEHYISNEPSVVLLVQTLISTVIIIVTAEFLPKTLIQFNPSLMLNIFAPLLLVFYILFYPVAVFMQLSAKFFIKYILRSKCVDNSTAMMPCRVDLDNLLKGQTENANENNDNVSQEAKLMRNALDFSNIKVRDCAVPRTEIVAVSIDSTMSELKDIFVESRYSKILVYEETIDNIVGYVHVSEMFKNSSSVRESMTPIEVVPETMSGNDLLKLFKGKHKSMALVVDEFGGTAGIVTLEDVLEEIFGEIDDEHDDVEYEEQQLSENEYLFAGRLEIDYLNDKYQLDLPISEEYDTLAGLVLDATGTIPEKGDFIKVNGFEIVVEESSMSKVDKLRVKKMMS